jgi:hypothetical protein
VDLVVVSKSRALFIEKSFESSGGELPPLSSGPLVVVAMTLVVTLVFRESCTRGDEMPELSGEESPPTLFELVVVVLVTVVVASEKRESYGEEEESCASAEEDVAESSRLFCEPGSPPSYPLPLSLAWYICTTLLGSPLRRPTECTGIRTAARMIPSAHNEAVATTRIPPRDFLE